MSSAFRSPPRDPEDPRSPLRQGELALPPPPHNTPVNPAVLPPLPRPPSPAAAIAKLSARDSRGSAETRAEDSGAVDSGWTVYSGIVRPARARRRAAVGARAAAAALCLVAFAVMAADKNKGWALDSFHHYKEYRYCVTVNVLGFLYSGFQAYAEVHHTISGKHIISRPMGYYFDFAMDQIFAYLLISASSSATTRTDEWVSNWGTDPFPNMARGSIAITYLAFMAFAFSSLVSAINLFKQSI